MTWRYAPPDDIHAFLRLFGAEADDPMVACMRRNVLACLEHEGLASEMENRMAMPERLIRAIHNVHILHGLITQAVGPLAAKVRDELDHDILAAPALLLYLYEGTRASRERPPITELMLREALKELGDHVKKAADKDKVAEIMALKHYGDDDDQMDAAFTQRYGLNARDATSNWLQLAGVASAAAIHAHDEACGGKLETLIRLHYAMRDTGMKTNSVLASAGVIRHYGPREKLTPSGVRDETRPRYEHMLARSVLSGDEKPLRYATWLVGIAMSIQDLQVRYYI